MINPSIPLAIPMPGNGLDGNDTMSTGNDASQDQPAGGMTFAVVLDQSRQQRDAGPQTRASSSAIYRQDDMKTSAPPAQETDDASSAASSAPENADEKVTDGSAQHTQTSDRQTQKSDKQDEPAKSETASADTNATAQAASTVNAAVTLLPLLPLLHAQVPVPMGPQVAANPAKTPIGLPVVAVPAASAKGAGTEPTGASVPATPSPISPGLPMDPHAAAQATALGIGNASLPALPTAQAGSANLPAAQPAVPSPPTPIPAQAAAVPNAPVQPVVTAAAQAPVPAQAVVAAPQTDKPQNAPSVGVAPAPVPQPTAASVPQAVTGHTFDTTVPTVPETPVSVSPDTAADHHDQLQRLLTVGGAPGSQTAETTAPKTPPASHQEVPATPMPSAPAANTAPSAHTAALPVTVPTAGVNDEATPPPPMAEIAPTIFAPTVSATDPALNATTLAGLPQGATAAKLPSGGEHPSSLLPTTSGLSAASSGTAQAVAASTPSGGANTSGRDGSQPHADQGTTQTPTPAIGAESVRPTESVTPSASTSTPPSSNMNRAQIIEQVTRQLDSMRLVNGRGEISFRLQPDSLGSLRLTITTHENGVTAHIVAENAQVRQAVEGATEHLRAALESKGLHLETLNVSVGQGNVADSQAGSAGAQNGGSSSDPNWGNPRRHVPRPTDPIILPNPRGPRPSQPSSRLEIRA